MAKHSWTGWRHFRPWADGSDLLPFLLLLLLRRPSILLIPHRDLGLGRPSCEDYWCHHFEEEGDTVMTVPANQRNRPLLRLPPLLFRWAFLPNGNCHNHNHRQQQQPAVDHITPANMQTCMAQSSYPQYPPSCLHHSLHQYWHLLPIGQTALQYDH